MPTRNDITGDTLVSKSANESYRDGWDRIFGNKMKLEELKKGTYAGVRFDKNSVRALKKWMRENKIKNPLRSDKFHTTLLYSRKYLPNYKALGDLDPPWKAVALTFDVFMTRPTTGEPTRALVLKINCPELEARHRLLMNEHEATYDFPVYTPHITFSYDIGDLDVGSLPAFTDVLFVNHEYQEDLDLGWATKK